MQQLLMLSCNIPAQSDHSPPLLPRYHSPPPSLQAPPPPPFSTCCTGWAHEGQGRGTCTGCDSQCRIMSIVYSMYKHCHHTRAALQSCLPTQWQGCLSCCTNVPHRSGQSVCLQQQPSAHSGASQCGIGTCWCGHLCKEEICNDHGAEASQQQVVAGFQAALGSEATRRGEHCLRDHHDGHQHWQLCLVHHLHHTPFLSVLLNSCYRSKDKCRIMETSMAMIAVPCPSPAPQILFFLYYCTPMTDTNLNTNINIKIQSCRLW